ncbi:MAG TPA: response regulator [bacterium]|mgnify:CR=1 FL=1|nr:response regulator [bacterium]
MKKILIIDDEPDIRNLIKEVLLINDFNDIFELPDAVNALELHRLNNFDLIILDYNLPGINGKEFVLDLWNNGFRTKVLLITGNSITADIKEMVGKKMATDYILKPFSIDKFSLKIKQIFIEI